MTPRIAVIPARYGAQRFPGKPLALLHGKHMIHHVFLRCQESMAFSQIVVATDDERIRNAALGFGAKVVMTSADCPSGTDRVAQVAKAMLGGPDDVFINVQGDEPAVHPESLAALAKAFDEKDAQMATLVRPLASEERSNPNVVKVVRDEAGAALYFSRADLPFARAEVGVPRWAHLGLYGYRRSTLERLASLAPTALEQTEGLEQLRALGHGVRIACVETTHATQAVDVPEDVDKAEAALTRLGYGKRGSSGTPRAE